MTCKNNTQYRLSADSSYIEGVIELMARTHGVDPTDLPPLYEAVDPEALERVLQSLADHTDPTGGTVEFTYNDHTVTVDARGCIHLAPE